MVAPPRGVETKLNAHPFTTTNLPISKGIILISIFQRVDGEVVRTNFVVPKRDGQKTKNVELSPPPRRRAKSAPHVQTGHGDGGGHIILVPLKLLPFDVRCIASPLGALKICGKMLKCTH